MHTRTSGITAGVAFGLSFLVGLIGGAGFPWLVFRALFFAAGFWGLMEAIYFISSKFLIEKPLKRTDDSLQKGTIVDISLDDEVQMPKEYFDADGEDIGEDAKDKSVTPYKTPETDPIKTELSTDAAEWTPDPPIQEVYRTENDDIASMSDTFMIDDEEVFKAPYTPKQSVSDEAFSKADPVKIVGAIRTLIKKD